MLVRLTAHLDAPVVLSDDLHLDGLLASAHPFTRGAPISRDTPRSGLVLPPLPVARASFGDHTVSLCTVAILPPTARMATNNAVSRRDAEDVEMLGRPVQLNLGPGKNRLHRLATVITPTIEWLCIGDRRGIKRLIRRISHIGSWRSAGYGVVRTWEAVEEEGDSMRVLTDGVLAQRHLPVSWCDWADSETAGAITPPYWHPAMQSERIVRAGTRCTIKSPIRELADTFADKATQIAHRLRHKKRAEARRAQRELRG